MKSFFKTLFVMIRRLPVATYLWCLFYQKESYYIFMVDYLGLLKINTNIDC